MADRPAHTGKAPELEKIKITPRMVKAGTKVLWDSCLTEHPMDGPDQLVIRRVYEAMRRLEPTG